MTIKSILGKMFVNDKQIVVLDDTAENGGIESGSNANGDYVKYPDGTMICFVKNTQSVDVTVANGSLFRSSAVTAITFPIAFIAIPTISITTSSVTATSLMSIQAWTLGTTSTKYIANSTSSLSALSITAEIIAIGRWK